MGPILEEMTYCADRKERIAGADLLSQLQSTTTPNMLLLSVEIRS